MITIYTKDNCPACISAKAQMTAAGQEFKEVLIGRDITREEFMAKFPHIRTVPYIETIVIPPQPIHVKKTITNVL